MNNKVKIIKPNLEDNDKYVDVAFSNNEKLFKEYYSSGNKDTVIISNVIDEVNWKMGAIYEQDNLMAAAEENEKTLLIYIIIVTIICIGFIYLSATKITKTIIGLNKVINKVSQGNFDITIEARTKGEIGQLSKYFNEMLKNIRALIKRLDNSVKEVKASAEQLSKISEETQASNADINSAITEITKGSAIAANESILAQQKSQELNIQV